jgi:hypothetical protein
LGSWFLDNAKRITETQNRKRKTQNGRRSQPFLFPFWVIGLGFGLLVFG